jgi:hypothetical protein
MKQVTFVLFMNILFCTSAKDWSKLDFKATLEKHVNGISTKNIDIIRPLLQAMSTQILQAKVDKTVAYGFVKYQLNNYNADRSLKSQSVTYLLLIF